MKIGLDFDGVISDCGKLKSEGAKLLYGINIPPEKFKIELVVKEGLLTLDQYRALQSQIYGTREIGLSMQKVEGVLEYTDRLSFEGHDLSIVTSRGKLESAIAVEWMKLVGLNIPLIGVGGGVSKAGACKNMDVYIDDDLDKLESLIGVVPSRFLFSWGYNEHINVPITIAQRVKSWEEFYFRIKDIERRQPIS